MGVDRTNDFRELTDLFFEQDTQPKQGHDVRAPQSGQNEADAAAFMTAALPLFHEIKHLHETINAQKTDYLNLNRHTVSSASLMTNEDRDHFETETTQVAQQESVRIDQLKAQLEHLKINHQTLCHCHLIVNFLFCTLQGVNEEIKRMRQERLDQLKRDKHSLNSKKFDLQSVLLESEIDINKEFQEAIAEEEAETSPQPVELSGEEELQFAQENEEFFKKMNDNIDKVRQAEAKLFQISRMMTLFTQKIAEQEQQVEELFNTAFDSNVNVQSGNQQLREAIQRGEGSRFMMLFIIALASFALLFLDWYM